MSWFIAPLNRRFVSVWLDRFNSRLLLHFHRYYVTAKIICILIEKELFNKHAVKMYIDVKIAFLGFCFCKADCT